MPFVGSFKRVALLGDQLQQLKCSCNRWCGCSCFSGSATHSQRALQTCWDYSTYSVTLLTITRDSSPRHARSELEHIAYNVPSSEQLLRGTQPENTVTFCPNSRRSCASHHDKSQDFLSSQTAPDLRMPVPQGKLGSGPVPGPQNLWQPHCDWGHSVYGQRRNKLRSMFSLV